MTTPATRADGMLPHLLETPWALLPSTLSRIVEYVGAHGDGREPAPPRILALEGPQAGAERVGSVAVIPVYGVIEHRADWLNELFGGTSVETVRGMIREAYADPSVRAIVLDIDSPGGTAAGVAEFAAELRSIRGGAKPIVAVANTLAASAAYWIGAQADELIVTPSGSVGSIGVYAVHQEVSRMLDEMGVTTTIVSAGPHKTEANHFEPLTPEARSMLQERTDAVYQMFLEGVAKGRRTTVGRVEAEYGGGRVLMAPAALAAGMVDRVETLDATLTRVARAAGNPTRGLRSEDALPDLESEAPVAEEAEPVVEGVPSFTERVAALATEAERVAEAAAHRARSRAAAKRPAFSTTTERALRASRDALDALLVGEPREAAVTPGEPAPPSSPGAPPRAIPPALPRITAEEFRARLKEL